MSQPLGSTYVLETLIGRGGMGEVWRGHASDGQELAFKLIRPELAQDPTLVARFLRERSILTQLTSPFVVPVRDLVAEHGKLAIVMDLITGSDLRAELRRRGTFPPAEALTLTADVLRGVAAAHALGIIHRDLKPANVLLETGPDGRLIPKIADFGIAMFTEDGTRLTLGSDIIGTPAYMAPEQAEHGAVGPAIDLYAAGVLLYELLCGTTPFVGPPMVVLRDHIERDPSRPGGLPDELWAVLSGLLAKDPQVRGSSAQAAADRLAALAPQLSGRSRLTPPSAPPTSLPSPPFSSQTGQQTTYSAAGERRLFVSMAGPDRPWSRWIVQQLHRAGYVVEYDEWSSRTGTSFVGQMEEARQKADRVIAVVSPHYLSYALEERGSAEILSDTDDGRLVPVLVEHCDLPPRLARMSYVKLVGMDESAARAELLRALAGPRAPANDMPFPGPSSKGANRAAGEPDVYFPGVPGLVDLDEADLDKAEVVARSPRWTRRRLLIGGTAAGVAAAAAVGLSVRSAFGGGPAALVARGSGVITCQLDWSGNVEFAGSYIAQEKDFYRKSGFSAARLLQGGMTNSPTAEDAVVHGEALVGLSAPDVTARKIVAGLDVRIVGALYQKYPFAVTYLNENPLAGPDDLIGKKIGVSSGALHLWNAFLQANNIEPDKVTVIDTDSPDALVHSQVDGILSTVSDAPVTLKLQNVDAGYFLLADNGYPLVSKVYVVSAETAKHQREVVAAFLRAEILGWRQNLTSPAYGVRLTMDQFGKREGLDRQTETLRNQELNKLIISDDAQRNGLLTITPELVELNVRALDFDGVPARADKLFDLSIINDLYRADPDLRKIV